MKMIYWQTRRIGGEDIMQRLTRKHRRRFSQVVSFLCIMCALTLPGAVNHTSAEELFESDIYLAGTNQQVLLFRQRNSITIDGDTTILGHTYTSVEGKQVAVEEVTLKHGEFQRYHIDFAYSDCSCVLSREGSKLAFSFTRGDADRRGEDDYVSDLVMGPTLTDFVHRKWDVLLRGETVYFHLPAMTLQRIARFQIRTEEDSPYVREGVIVVKMDIANIFLRLLVDPVELVYELRTKRLLEIHGESLLQYKVNGRMEHPVVDIYYRYGQ